MRVLILIILLFHPIFCLSKIESQGEPIFEIKSFNRYGLQYTNVFRKNGNYVCETNLTPYFETSEEPVSKEVLKTLHEYKHKDILSTANCQNKIIITEFKGNLKTIFIGCREQWPFSNFMRELDRNCGRN